MAYFDRFDICEAYLAVEQGWHMGGWLRERPSNVRRGRARGYVGVRPGAGWRGFDSLTENGQDIYRECCARWGLGLREEG